MADKEKLKQDVHDLLKMVTRDRYWIDTVEKLSQRIIKRTRNWLDKVEERAKEIVKDIQ